MMWVRSSMTLDRISCVLVQMPQAESYSRILTAHLQSANSELREVDGLNSVVNQLNWRGDNKIAHLLGASPMIAPEQLVGAPGLEAYKSSIKDFSILPTLPVRKVCRSIFIGTSLRGADDALSRPRQDLSTQPSVNRLHSTLSFEDSTTKRHRSLARSWRAQLHSESLSPSG